MIQPYSNSYLEQYFKEFTDEIVKYQYPDSFCDMNKADEVMSKFVTDMEQGKMLELVILTHDGEFLGSMEVDLCQYFGHKKLNFSPSITYAERIIS